MEQKCAIIAVGYNRKRSLKRLLDFLNIADYGNDTVSLIISLDNCGTDEVQNVANEFVWEHGKKIIRTFPARQGLKKHILSCGDYFAEYDVLFVFEDDIVVAPYFYQYGKMCISHYWEDKRIEGISLHLKKWSQNANFPFEPLKTKYDTFFQQCPESVGQIWFKDRFQEFYSWYCQNENFFEGEKNKNIPEILYTWGKNSWYRYHIAYCILKDKYFVYPYYSFATQFGEDGTHISNGITRFQSELMVENVSSYKLAEFDEAKVVYDGFNENIKLKEYLEKQLGGRVTVDLYGRKRFSDEDEYVISTQILPYHVEKKYGLQLRPFELNVYMNIEGDGIYLYNVRTPETVSKKEKQEQIVRKWNYFMRDRFLMWDEIIPVCKQKINNVIRIQINKWKKGKWLWKKNTLF